MIPYTTNIIENLKSLDVRFVGKFDARKKHAIKYANIPCAFDIETTSTLINENEKFAFMYEWTFGIKDNNYICYGRTWEDFVTLCQQLQVLYELSPDKILIVYVHNLSFEFQFMRKYFNWENVFAVDDRKPIKALCSYGIEFRDSYILSGYSLAKLAENLTSHKIKKLVGDLDYSLVRTSITYLTDEELAYCNNDVEILLDYIDEQMHQYKDITKIPLTNTGRVRIFVRNNCLHYSSSHKKEGNGGKIKRYRMLMKECSLNLEQYAMMKRAFMGGFTHASLKYSGKLLYDMDSIDFTSSYPYVMLSEKYPMSRPLEVELTNDNIDAYLNDSEYGLVFDCVLENVHSCGTYETYLSESKCRNIQGGIINNGRVFQADYLETTITNIDFEIIRKCYASTLKVTFGKAYKFYMQYLPKQILLSILDLYEGKTVLKNVKGMEVEYLLKKGMLNSVYGMCVTDIIREENIYEGGNWDRKRIAELTKESMEEQLDKYNNSRQRFLYYPWGVFVTAYARRNLWEGIFEINEDYVYSDTDSIKLLNYNSHRKWIDSYNENVKKKLKRMCDFRKIDFNKCRPKTIDGKVKLIGVFDYDGHYPMFKTLGAKRYMYTDENNQLHITIAGLSKQNGVGYLLEKYKTIENVFNHFDDNLFIPSYATGKNTHTYIDGKMESDIIDYTGQKYHVVSESSIHLEPCEFTLSISRQYGNFLKNLAMGYLSLGSRYI